MTDVVTAPKRSEFTQLFTEFVHSYPETADAQAHMALYVAARRQAEENYARLIARAARGDDITDDVLLKLLAHTDTVNHRWQGAWVHPNPTVVGTVQSWYEAAGWTQPGEWPAIARAILQFVQRCVEVPEQLRPACRAFSELAHTKGFQSGTLSPILNALRPEHFSLINNASRNLLNYFASANYGGQLTEYPAANAALRSLTDELLSVLQQHSLPQLSPADTLDLFGHWLVTVKRFSFREVRYWLVELTDEPGLWYEFRQGNFVGLTREGHGWEELGDLSGVRRREFIRRRDSLVAQYDDWTKRGTEQLWRFARQPAEGDRVLVQRGAGRVLGVGTIGGGYYFAQGVPAGHRYPVTWDDTDPRAAELPRPTHGFDEIDRATFAQALQAPVLEAERAAQLAADTWESVAPETPPFLRYVAPLVDALRALGGSARAGEAIERTLALHSGSGGGSEGNGSEGNGGGNGGGESGSDGSSGGSATNTAQRHVRRARDLLAESGLLETPRRGVWRLVASTDTNSLAPADVLALYREAEYGRRLAQLEAGEAAPVRTLAEGRPTYDAAPYDAAPYDAAPYNAEPQPDEVPDGEPEPFPPQPPYTLAECAAATGFAEDELTRWVRSIERKGQAVLYGPPGTGKTFLAEHLARHLIGGSDGFVERVQFHPAYAYEDFVQGIRPQPGPNGTVTYPLVPGRFLEFCARARPRQGRCVLIIDELNRANLARVFGELMYLLEYRENAIVLAGSGEPFHIPSNVRLLGTMNTADRSIALIDHALRRRFAFIALAPNYEVLRHFHARHGTDFPVEALITLLQRLNRHINDPQYAVGVSFFLDEHLAENVEDIWRMEIEPYLEELFFDQPERVDAFRWERVRINP